MALTEDQKNKRREWNDANQEKLYDSIRLVIKRGNKDILKAIAKENGESVNQYINNLIYDDCRKRGIQFELLEKQGKNTRRSASDNGN